MAAPGRQEQRLQPLLPSPTDPMEASLAPEQRLASLSDIAVMTQPSRPTGTNFALTDTSPFILLENYVVPPLTSAATRALGELCAVDAPCG